MQLSSLRAGMTTERRESEIGAALGAINSSPAAAEVGAEVLALDTLFLKRDLCHPGAETLPAEIEPVRIRFRVSGDFFQNIPDRRLREPAPLFTRA